jgi:anti-sigma regulatory factor (Ser/Thr protein kinase)
MTSRIANSGREHQPHGEPCPCLQFVGSGTVSPRRIAIHTTANIHGWACARLAGRTSLNLNMPNSAPAVPPDITWRGLAPRLAVVNQVLVFIAALSMYGTETLAAQGKPILGFVYHLVWLQCNGLAGSLITANVVLALARGAWRKSGGHPDRYYRQALYMGLSARSKWQLLACMLPVLMLSSWLAQQLFAYIQGTAWGLLALPQVSPGYSMTFIYSVYGMACILTSEYIRDRITVSEARARMAQKLTAQAQLNLLRSQLDPHMLFNTLSNVHELIEECPPQAQSMLLHLMGFLRATLDSSRATEHTLAEEFQLTSDYLQLMQIRMGDRLLTRLELPKSLQAAKVPAMLLQPLVENAIKHGLEPRKMGGDLTVSASHADGQLILRVSNAGCPPQNLPSTAQPNPPRPSGGYGLQHVRDRLHELYGNRAHFDMKFVTEPAATQVSVSLPLTLMARTA